ncbi:hypothetical protein DFH09DRAFT_1250899 [Mycena vulgaris]|nr:hypothetical protein DFH09DRAFT_1250899 [Mycena vulgaris]
MPYPEQKIKLLKLYMESLPQALPFADVGDSINKLLSFSLDADWVESIGEEMAVNCKIETAMFGFGRRNDQGIISITTRGPGIKSLAGILRYWLAKYPEAGHLQRWVDNATASAAAVILFHNEPVCSVKEKGKKKKKGAAKPSAKKPDTKLLTGTDDPAHDSVDELDDDRVGSRKLDPLLLKISKPIWAANGENEMVWCAASAGCKTLWAWPRAKGRILKHAMSCSWLASIDRGSLVAAAIERLAESDPKLIDRLNDKFGLPSQSTSKRPHEALKQVPPPPIEAPPLKRAKISASTLSSQKSTTQSTPVDGAPGNSQRDALPVKGDDVLIELFSCCGILSRIIGREEFKTFVNTISQGNYNLPSHTTFEDALIPSYAASVQITVIKYLQSCSYLSISTDGGKLKKKKFISVNITNVHRQSFYGDLDDVSRVSQTVEYFAELLTKIITEIKELLGFMSLSSYSQDWFDEARKELSISCGLQSILQKHFLDDDDIFKFKRDLTRLGAVLMPFARAIQCLESKDTNPADVYLYWLAIIAQLNGLISKDDNAGTKSKYAKTVKELIRSISNFRFSQLIEEERASNVYFTVFVLDPDNWGAIILAAPNLLAVQPVTISFTAGQPAVKEQSLLIQRVGLSLQKILQKEYGDEYRPDRTVEEAKAAMMDINPFIAHCAPADALFALCSQLKDFLNGDAPFARKKKPKESSRDWWLKLLDREDADILAALAVKIFSANPVSMPNERGMSTEAPSKPVTINWCDIRETIHGKPKANKNKTNTRSDSDSESDAPALKPHEPVREQDGLSWLNDGLPDLRTASSNHFDLAAEFDIERYLHILVDNIEGPAEVQAASSEKEITRGTVQGSSKVLADSVAPKADEWSSWG